MPCGVVVDVAAAVAVVVFFNNFFFLQFILESKEGGVVHGPAGPDGPAPAAHVEGHGPLQEPRRLPALRRLLFGQSRHRGPRLVARHARRPRRHRHHLRRLARLVRLSSSYALISAHLTQLDSLRTYPNQT